MTFTASTITFVDGASATKTANSYTDGTNQCPAHVLLDNTGAIVPLVHGHGVAASALLCELPTDGTGVVGLNAGTKLIGAISAQPLIVAGSAFTRVADTNAYASGDFIGNSVTAASCTIANSGWTIAIARGTDIPGRITGAILQKSTTTITNAIFAAHLYNVNPLTNAPAGGDNAAFAPANIAGYLGYIDFSLTRFAHGDGVRARGIIASASFINFAPASGTSNLFAILEVRGAYAPGNAETFTLTLEAE